MFQQGLTLKELLENPELLNPVTVNTGHGSPAPAKQKKVEEATESGQSAFLRPTIWDNTLPYSEEILNLEYMDLDEFLLENSLEHGPAEPMLSQTGLITPPLGSLSPAQQLASPQRLLQASLPSPQASMPSPQASMPSPQMSLPSPSIAPSTSSSSPSSPAPPSPSSLAPQLHQHLTTAAAKPIKAPKRRVEEDDAAYDSCDDEEMEPDANDLALVRMQGQKDFDPRTRQFSREELRPQPMIKKSRKIYVPDEQKDDKYWSRRKKNNVAAKRSRDARRVKENQIAMRASFLEKTSDALRVELAAVRQENDELRKRLEKYEGKA